MENRNIQTALGFSVIAITKYLMQYFSVDHEEAYKRLVGTEFYELLIDPDTGLYLESDQYLCKGCMIELEQGKEKMYEFINQE